MALTIVLLTGSGLLIHSFLKLRSVDKGFASLSTVTAGIQLDGRYNQPRQTEFFHALLERVRALPGVQEAAAVDRVPLGGGESISQIEVEGYPFDPTTSFESRLVTPRYFATMGIPLLEGRDFDDGDPAGRTPVILVSRSFARRYFPGRSALGAQNRSIAGLILRQGMTLWLAGIGLGMACAWGVTRWLRSLLFEVQPTDPLTFAGAATLFCAVAALACYIPARRATRVDPIMSLRYE